MTTVATATGIPLDTTREIIGLPQHDVLLKRAGAHTGSPSHEPPSRVESDMRLQDSGIISPEAGPADVWYLAGCVRPADSLSRIPLNALPFRIGRNRDTDLTLPSPRVSGFHAEVYFEDGEFLVRDLDSTNGTYLNGRRIRQPSVVGHGDLVEFADVEFRVECEQADNSSGGEASALDTHPVLDAFESSWVITQFDQLVRNQAVSPHFQPIVSMEDEMRVYGYEALARSALPGMEGPREMFLAAEQLNREVELSDLCRAAAFRQAARLEERIRLFVNTHPAEDLQTDVLPSLERLRSLDDRQCIIVEIHEAAVTDPHRMKEFRSALTDLDIQLAYDDFGRGQARLVELIEAPPDFVKFDCGLLHNIESTSHDHVNVVRLLVSMMQDVGILTIAEGIETPQAAQICRDIGFDLAQGYYFGRPAPFAHVVRGA